MAYREVRRMDIDQIIRRWLAGEKIRAIARSTGADRNTVRRIVRFAEKEGIGQETPWPDEGKLQVIRQHMGRPGTTVASSEPEQRLKPRTEQIRAWLDKDHLLLSKVHALLGREGLAVSYSSLYRSSRSLHSALQPDLSGVCQLSGLSARSSQATPSPGQAAC